MARARIVHYLNQFFAGIGGEEKADATPEARAGAIGPGAVLVSALADKGEVVGTVFCGDNYMGMNPQKATEEVVALVSKFKPDVVVAGPAFLAGRYGQACGLVCNAVQEQLSIPAIASMHPDNPAVEIWSTKLYIVPAKETAAGMTEAIKALVPITLKLVKGETIGPPSEEGYIQRGIRVNVVSDRTAAARTVEMLVKRLHGEATETERPLPQYDRVAPPAPITDLATTKIALVTTAGLVPKGNPDRLEATFATKWLKYNIAEYSALPPEAFEPHHAGYNGIFAREDPNRVVPLDVLKDMEAQGAIGDIHDYLYTTSASGMSIRRATTFGKEIAQDLLKEGVSGVILTSTWGTCTRGGATIAKEIERVGIGTTIITAMTSLAESIGSNRIVTGKAIPHPTGDPTLPREEEKAFRRRLLRTALESLKTKLDGQKVFYSEG